MYTRPTNWAEVDEQGRLTLPVDLIKQYGLEPGARVRIDTDNNSLRLHRPATHLAKVYVEPTNFCNIDCLTCMRNNWEVEIGHMSAATFDRVLARPAKHLSAADSPFWRHRGAFVARPYC